MTLQLESNGGPHLKRFKRLRPNKAIGTQNGCALRDGLKFFAQPEYFFGGAIKVTWLWMILELFFCAGDINIPGLVVASVTSTVLCLCVLCIPACVICAYYNTGKRKTRRRERRAMLSELASVTTRSDGYMIIW